AFSPSATLQPDISALACTPVTLARKQLKSRPRLWLAWSAARHSFSATKAAHESVAFELAGKTPWACSFGVSFFSVSVRLPFDSTEFLESLSFFTHLMGFRECELCDPDEFELTFASFAGAVVESSCDA